MLRPESRALGPAELVGGLAERCQQQGLPLLRVSMSVRTLHPEVLAQSVRWDRGKGLSSARVPHAVKGTSQYVGSPAERVIEGADGFVVSFDGGPRPSHPAYDELE